jgi:hypothetical protein
MKQVLGFKAKRLRGKEIKEGIIFCGTLLAKRGREKKRE